MSRGLLGAGGSNSSCDSTPPQPADTGPEGAPEPPPPRPKQIKGLLGEDTSVSCVAQPPPDGTADVGSPSSVENNAYLMESEEIIPESRPWSHGDVRLDTTQQTEPAEDTASPEQPSAPPEEATPSLQDPIEPPSLPTEYVSPSFQVAVEQASLPTTTMSLQARTFLNTPASTEVARRVLEVRAGLANSETPTVTIGGSEVAPAAPLADAKMASKLTIGDTNATPEAPTAVGLAPSSERGDSGPQLETDLYSEVDHRLMAAEDGGGMDGAEDDELDEEAVPVFVAGHEYQSEANLREVAEDSDFLTGDEGDEEERPSRRGAGRERAGESDYATADEDDELEQEAEAASTLLKKADMPDVQSGERVNDLLSRALCVDIPEESSGDRVRKVEAQDSGIIADEQQAVEQRSGGEGSGGEGSGGKGSVGQGSGGHSPGAPTSVTSKLNQAMADDEEVKHYNNECVSAPPRRTTQEEQHPNPSERVELNVVADNEEATEVAQIDTQTQIQEAPLGDADSGKGDSMTDMDVSATDDARSPRPTESPPAETGVLKELLPGGEESRATFNEGFSAQDMTEINKGKTSAPYTSECLQGTADKVAQPVAREEVSGALVEGVDEGPAPDQIQEAENGNETTIPKTPDEVQEQIVVKVSSPTEGSDGPSDEQSKHSDQCQEPRESPVNHPKEETPGNSIEDQDLEEVREPIPEESRSKPEAAPGTGEAVKGDVAYKSACLPGLIDFTPADIHVIPPRTEVSGVESRGSEFQTSALPGPASVKPSSLVLPDVDPDLPSPPPERAEPEGTELPHAAAHDGSSQRLTSETAAEYNARQERLKSQDSDSVNTIMDKSRAVRQSPAMIDHMSRGSREIDEEVPDRPALTRECLGGQRPACEEELYVKPPGDEAGQGSEVSLVSLAAIGVLESHPGDVVRDQSVPGRGREGMSPRYSAGSEPSPAMGVVERAECADEAGRTMRSECIRDAPQPTQRHRIILEQDPPRRDLSERSIHAVRRKDTPFPPLAISEALRRSLPPDHSPRNLVQEEDEDDDAFLVSGLSLSMPSSRASGLILDHGSRTASSQARRQRSRDGVFCNCDVDGSPAVATSAAASSPLRLPAQVYREARSGDMKRCTHCGEVRRMNTTPRDWQARCMGYRQRTTRGFLQPSCSTNDYNRMEPWSAAVSLQRGIWPRQFCSARNHRQYPTQPEPTMCITGRLPRGVLTVRYLLRPRTRPPYRR